MSVLGQIIDKVHARREKWNTVEAPNLPLVWELQETTILGSYSYCGLSTKTRTISVPLCIPVDHCIETPSALARDYLLIEYKKSPPGSHTQIEVNKSGLRGAPNFALPCNFSDGFYIDIKSAYWSILNVVGWDVDYWPERWLGAGKPPTSFPFHDSKPARNCLVSCAMTKGVPMYTPGRGIFTVEKGNGLSNVQINRLVMDVLNAIAGQAIDAGAVYANTDGFIAPDDKVLERIEGIISDWGLVSRIKASGGGGVRGSGSYMVGRAKSGLWGREPEAINQVERPRYTRWLQERFSFWAAKRAI